MLYQVRAVSQKNVYFQKNEVRNVDVPRFYETLGRAKNNSKRRSNCSVQLLLNNAFFESLQIVGTPYTL